MVEEVLQENLQTIQDYLDGKDSALRYLVGQIMKKTKGKANPKMASELLETALEALGFQCWRLPFSENGTPDVDNLFARLGTGSPHFCFAGHVDVVPEGEVSKWSHPPFEADIFNKYLFRYLAREKFRRSDS